MNICYIGDFSKRGHAYPIINNAFVAGLRKNGYKVSENIYSLEDTLVDLFLCHEYPIRPNINQFGIPSVCFTAWEFATPGGFPIVKRKAINTHNALGVPCQWIKDQIETVIDVPIIPLRWGISESDVKNIKKLDLKKYNIPQNKILLLWVGGTDKRHGFDILCKVAQLLPDHYHVIAKQSIFYPGETSPLPNMTIIREDFISLIPLYKACDIFLQTGRGIGFSLPTLEALACGLPVLSTDLPPIREFKADNLYFSEKGQWVETTHHLYSDCVPVYWKPDVGDFAETLISTSFQKQTQSKVFFDYYNYTAIAKEFMEKLCPII